MGHADAHRIATDPNGARREVLAAEPRSILPSFRYPEFKQIDLEPNRKEEPSMNIIHHPQPLPRRTFLKGAGITLALPWLDAMSVHADSLTKGGSIGAGETPRRAMFTFWGLGINGRDFTPV